MKKCVQCRTTITKMIPYNELCVLDEGKRSSIRLIFIKIIKIFLTYWKSLGFLLVHLFFRHKI